MPSQTHTALYWLSVTATLAMVGWVAWQYSRAVRNGSHFEPADVVFQEWFASGCSQKNIITKIGGGRNCVRLVVTKSSLWVTSWFPFSLIAPFYDMEHVIPLDAIVSVRSSGFLGRRTFLLTYRGVTGDPHTLRLLPRKPDDFTRSLGVKIENESLA
jgi:hypothetical protein